MTVLKIQVIIRTTKLVTKVGTIRQIVVVDTVQTELHIFLGISLILIQVKNM
jgi:hypothetical protein